MMISYFCSNLLGQLNRGYTELTKLDLSLLHTMLYGYLWRSDIESVRRGKQNGGNVSGMNDYGYTPLHFAMQNGRNQHIVLLLNYDWSLHIYQGSETILYHWHMGTWIWSKAS